MCKIVKNADSQMRTWNKSGAKQAIELFETTGQDFAHDVSVIGDILLAASNETKRHMVTAEFRDNLYDDHNIQKRGAKTGSFRSYHAVFTYTLNMIALKFGEDAVTRGYNANGVSFRGYARKPEIIDYARMMAASAVARAEAKVRSAA